PSHSLPPSTITAVQMRLTAAIALLLAASSATASRLTCHGPKIDDFRTQPAGAPPKFHGISFGNAVVSQVRGGPTQLTSVSDGVHPTKAHPIKLHFDG